MFCKYCGNEVNDNAVVCTKCGCPAEKNASTSVCVNRNKRPLGVLFCIFFGLIGLIIGILMYDRNSEEFKTFRAGWLKCFVVELIIYAVIAVLSILVAGAVALGILLLGSMAI